MRLEAQGWLETRWEEGSTPGRPRRHLYRLTPDGQAEAHAVLTSHSAPARVRLARMTEEGA
jgi:DNA-binding PadR family transcriptional regulator